MDCHEGSILFLFMPGGPVPASLNRLVNGAGSVMDCRLKGGRTKMGQRVLRAPLETTILCSC